MVGRTSTRDARLPRLTDQDYRVLADFRRAIRGFLAFSAEGAAERDLTAQQHQALLAIRAHLGAEAMTVGALAAELAIKNHSALGLVDRLVEGGYARRTASTLDRRRVLVELTPAGASVLEAISMRNLGQLSRASTILERLLHTANALAAAPSPHAAAQQELLSEDPGPHLEGGGSSTLRKPQGLG